MNGRVVVSSLTGKPIPWGEDADRGTVPADSATDAPVIPDRLEEDRPEPGETEAHDAQILRDVPPHWGSRG